VLSARPGEHVVLARDASGLVVLRLSRDPVGAGAELAVLMETRARGLARFLGAGPLPGGGIFLKREWIEGQDLASFVSNETLSNGAQRARDPSATRGLDPRAAAQLVRDAALALDGLHRSGFVHGDIKPANFVRRPDGELVLTDFGLARHDPSLAGRRRSAFLHTTARAGSEGSTPGAAGAPDAPGGGTYGFVAPEVLVGGAPSVAADLFSLGVTWLTLRGVALPSLAELYGRFPAEPFTDAAGVDLTAFDDNTRDLLVELLHRDPQRRPANAAALAQRIAVRFRFKERARRQRLEPPPWSHVEGRQVFLATSLTRLVAMGGLERWRVAHAADGPLFAREAALHAAVNGAAIELVNLDVELGALADSVALDRWLARLERRAESATLVLVGALDGGAPGHVLGGNTSGAGAWSSVVLEALHGLVYPRGAAWIDAHTSATKPSDVEVPPQSRDSLAALLARILPGASVAERDSLVDALEVEARGSSAEAAERVAELFLRGPVEDSAEGARLAADTDPQSVFRSPLTRVDGRELSVEARSLLVALRWLGALDAEGCARVAGLGSTRELDTVLELLVDAGLVRVTPSARGRSISTRVEVSALELGLDRSARRALYARLADRTHATGASPARSASTARHGSAGRAVTTERTQPPELPERYWAARYLAHRDAALPSLLAEVQELHERGLDGRIRAGLTALRACLTSEGEPVPQPLLRELARALVVLRDTRGAEEVARGLGSGREAEQLRLEVRARTARALGRSAEAAALFTELGFAAEACVERMQAAHDRADGDAVQHGAELARAALARHSNAEADSSSDQGAESGSWPLIELFDAFAIAALSALRQGEHARAAEWLKLADCAGARSGNVLHSAVQALNLGTAARRTGDLAAARRHFERAVRVYRDLGHAVGLAQARLGLSGVLRELGLVAQAEPLVHEALGTRRRFGDAAGAATARGMLGLALAERGHLHAARIELAGAAEDLRRAGRSEQALLVRARAEEVRARTGYEVADHALAAEAAAPGVDPRVHLALARAAWCRGDLDHAALSSVAAVRAAEALGRTADAREAALIQNAILPIDATEHAAPRTQLDSTATATDDERVLATLAAPTFDGPDALNLAQELELRGRDDRAARVALAVAARDVDTKRREHAAGLARNLLERVTLGADADAAGRALHFLLGRPDPWPRDLDTPQHALEDEMDVLKLLSINERLVEQEDLDPLLRAIVEAAVGICGAERGFLVLEENGELSLDRALDSSLGDLEPDEVEYSGTIVRAALDSGAPLRLADAGEDVLHGDAQSVATFHLRSVLCQPFDVDETLRGAIVVDDRRRPGAFAQREERLLGLLAGQAALAVRQVRRLERIKRLKDELAARVVEREGRLEIVERRLEAGGHVAPVEGLIGESSVMQAAHRLLRKLAPSELAILVVGESGTGKDVAARALHSLSSRARGPFIAENCAALPATLLEAELFGARRGSYTGSERDREGLFERANGGTLFLDEIGELPLEQQAKLLRVLETHEVRRVGDNEVRTVDFRLVTATNRDLEAEVRAGRFREDLMYRLDGVRVVMPPLRERIEDLPLLVAHFLRLIALNDGRARRVSPEVVRALAARPWPGNVRELANEIARLAVLSDGDLTDPSLIRTPSSTAATSAGGARDLVRPLEELEREAITAALERTGGDKRRAAELLGISRAKIYQRLKDWRLDET